MLSLGHPQVVDADLRVGAPELQPQFRVRLHRLDVAQDLVARVRQFDEERAVTLVARRVRVGLGHHERDVGDAGGRTEPLLAVQDPLVAVEDRRRLHPGGVRAGRLLRHRVADAFLAVQQRLQVLLLLFVRAVLDEREHGGVVGTLGVEGEGAEEALAEFHLHERVGQRPQSHASLLHGHERTPQALGARLLPQSGEHLVEVVRRADFLRGVTFLLHELADLVAHGPGVFRYLEIDHVGFPCCDSLRFVGLWPMRLAAVSSVPAAPARRR